MCARARIISSPSTIIATPRSRVSAHRAFSLTELLVVIAIIVLLVGLLLVALGAVRNKARQADTESIMQAFAQACESFQIDHGFYPGAIPEDVLEANPNIVSTTEMAILQMMGGARFVSPLDPNGGAAQREYDAMGACDSTSGPYCASFGGWKLKVDLNRIGEGPLINNKPYSAYFTVSGREFAVSQGQAASQVGSSIIALPDLIDSWGQPILYVRRLRTVGPLVGEIEDRPQFTRAGLEGYIRSTELGELGLDQQELSILNIGSEEEKNAIFAQIIRHPAFGPEDPRDGAGLSLELEPRGGFALISAGPDGIYFSKRDGPGSAEDEIGDEISIDEFLGDQPPNIIDEFDDIRIFGGG